MKNIFKFGFLAFAISLSVAACGSNKEAGATDSTSADTTMADTSMTGMDTTAKDTAATDTLVKDTTKM